MYPKGYNLLNYYIFIPDRDYFRFLAIVGAEYLTYFVGWVKTTYLWERWVGAFYFAKTLGNRVDTNKGK